MSDGRTASDDGGVPRAELLRMTIEEFVIELVEKEGYTPADVAAELLRAEMIVRTGKVVR